MSPNPESILDSVKQAIGLDSSDTTFDLDVVLFINSTFGSLKQLGVSSSVTGFMIADNSTLWSQYVGDLAYLGMIKSYVVMKVKLLFDPPEGRTTLPAIEKVLEELTFRINVEAENINPPSDPFGAVNDSEDVVLGALISPKVVQLEFASSITPDASAGNVFYLTMTGDCTINSPINGSDGQHITLEITSNGHAVTWRSGWDFGTAGSPTLSDSGLADIVSAYYRQSVANWRAGFASGF